ncbi:MAG: alpha/beta hydrolase, partial [Myxococcota bacterium]
SVGRPKPDRRDRRLTDGALYATACADAPIDSIADLRDTEEAIEAGAAVFRRELYASLFPCESWDAVTPAIDWESVLGGLFNVMVVTADGDPIVPKAVSDSLLSGISSVSEVNSSDFSHGFGLRGVNSCVDNAILGFLVEGLSQDTECP